jgi:hypothetical protein
MDDDGGIACIPSHRPHHYLALVLLVFLGFAAYPIFLVAKWLIGLVS